MEQSELIAGLKRGDPKIQEHLFNIYSKKVYNTVISYLQNAEDAEETTQDVFIEVFGSINTFKKNSNLSTWIYRITVNKSLDRIRYNKRKKRFAVINDLFDSMTGEVSKEVEREADFYHPGMEIEKKESSAILFKAVNKLPENQKTAFILSKIEGLSYKEISEIMKTGIPSVESLLFRSKQNLKKYLSRYYDEFFLN